MNTHNISKKPANNEVLSKLTILSLKIYETTFDKFLPLILDIKHIKGNCHFTIHRPTRKTLPWILISIFIGLVFTILISLLLLKKLFWPKTTELNVMQTVILLICLASIYFLAFSGASIYYNKESISHINALIQNELKFRKENSFECY